MLERYERDVLAHAPRYVLIWGFINDYTRNARGEAPAGGRGHRTADHRRWSTRPSRAASSAVLATEVTMPAATSWSGASSSPRSIGAMGRTGYADRINTQVMNSNRWLKQFAAQRKLAVLDLQRALAPERFLSGARVLAARRQPPHARRLRGAHRIRRNARRSLQQMSKLLRVAIFGGGRMADEPCDGHPSAARHAVRRGGRSVPEPRGSARAIRRRYRALQGSGRSCSRSAKPDVVHIVTPPHTHYPLAHLRSTNGASVYVEKPFALTRTRSGRDPRPRRLERPAGHRRAPGAVPARRPALPETPGR